MNKKRIPFKNKIHMALCLLGIIPYLLTGYVFIQLHLSITQTISLFSAMILVFHFAGFHILRKFSDELLTLVKQSTLPPQRGQKYSHLPIDKNDTGEVFTIKNNFNNLLEKLEAEKERFNEVTTGLLIESRKDSLEYERRLRGVSPYVDQKVIHQIMNEGNHEGERILRSERRHVAVLFLDICAFTKVSEELPPEDIVQMLNEFFDTAVQIIYQHNGMVDKFIGDAIMATFGLTTPIYQVSVDAVCTGMELQEAAKKLMLKRAEDGKPTFKIRVGINTGSVIAGDIGSNDRMDYTVIGDAVNVASRMCDHAEPDAVLISGDTYHNCRSYFKASSKGKIKVKNRYQAIEAFEIKGKDERTFQQHVDSLPIGKVTMQGFQKLR